MTGTTKSMTKTAKTVTETAKSARYGWMRVA